MRIKLKHLFIIAIISFISLFTAFTYKALNVDVFGETTTTGAINPNSDTKFSKYLNIMPQGVYSSPINVKSLSGNTTYNIAENYKDYVSTYYPVDELYSTLSYENIGFKCNGTFYRDEITIETDGTYVFNVYTYKSENGLIKPSSSVLETITITYEESAVLTLETDTFYFEHYSSKAYLASAIEDAFNYSNVSLTSSSIVSVYDAFNVYLAKKIEEPDDDISSTVDVYDLLINVTWNTETYSKIINIVSISNPDISSNFLTTASDIKKCIPKFAFDVLYDEEIQGMNFKTFLDQIDLVDYIDLPDGQEIYLDFYDRNLNIPYAQDLKSSTNYKMLQAQYDIIDSTLGKTYTDNYVNIVFYNSAYLTDAKYRYDIELNDDYSITVGSTISNLYNLFSTCSSYVTIGYQEYLDGFFEMFPNVKVSSLDTSSIGQTTMSLLVYSTRKDDDGAYYSYALSYDVNISDKYAPKILTNYNYIIVTKDSEDYYDQIKLIDDIAVDEKSFTIEMTETSSVGGYFTISVSDTSGNKTTRVVPYLYKNSKTLYEKTLGSWLYKYGKFLKSLI